MSASTRNKHSTPSVSANAKSNAPSATRPAQFDNGSITKDEFERISDALKNAEFRKLFLEYCEEIQDPENRSRYEEEIIQLEAERGVAVRFVNPEPGFVVKTAVDGVHKCFVNVAKSDAVAKPTSEACINPNTGKRGLNWSIPLAQSAPRDDLDAHGKRCRVYDVIFHPDALYLAQRNQAFRKCLIDTALDAVEREFQVTLDRTNLRFPKLQFKGVARPTVIRKLVTGASSPEPHPLDSIYPAMPPAEPPQPTLLPQRTEVNVLPEFTTPTYVIKHQRDVVLAEYTNEPDAKFGVTVPHQLIVEIALPLLNSTAECRLDVTERALYLLSERPNAKYRLHLTLPFPVNDKSGSARFDTDTRQLIISLPVLQPSPTMLAKLPGTPAHQLSREDSGVESDVRDELNSNGGASPHEELTRTSAPPETKQEDDVPAATPVQPEAITLSTTFLSNAVQYRFPNKFDSNVLENELSIVLHVRNVQPESIAILRQIRSVHLQFSTISGGYYPALYAFYLQLLPNVTADIASAEAEVWENNVVLNLTLNGSAEELHAYMAGIDHSNLSTYNIQKKLGLEPNTQPSTTAPDISVNRSAEDGIEIEVGPRLRPPQVEKPDLLNKKQKRGNKKRRSLSESACDDIKSYQQQQMRNQTLNAIGTHDDYHNDCGSTGDNSADCVEECDVVGGHQQQQVLQRYKLKQRSYSESRSDSNVGGGSAPSFKGILKHHTRYGPRRSISDSCSSIDDCSSSYSCSGDDGSGGAGSLLRFAKSFSDIPEENVEGLSESCKKSVRFNEVITKQIFRLDSSILGQRKKNQKRRDRKQRALQRRLSEGDSADYDENNPTDKPIVLSCKQSSATSGRNIKPTQHDSGLDLTSGNIDQFRSNNKNNGNSNRERPELESPTDIDGSKNLMMFEMDM